MDALDGKTSVDSILNIMFIIFALVINVLYQKPWFVHIDKVVPGAYMMNKSASCLLAVTIVLIVSSCTFTKYPKIKLLVSEVLCIGTLRDELRFLGHSFVKDVANGLTIYYKLTIVITIMMCVVMLLRYIQHFKSCSCNKAHKEENCCN